jgi:hypothetical protein
MNRANITPQTTVKILEMYLDKQLYMNKHIQKAAQRTKVQTMTLKTLQRLRLAAMRQLYISTVASKLDYTAPIWFQAKQSLQTYKTFETV